MSTRTTGTAPAAVEVVTDGSAPQHQAIPTSSRACCTGSLGDSGDEAAENRELVRRCSEPRWAPLRRAPGRHSKSWFGAAAVADCTVESIDDAFAVVDAGIKIQTAAKRGLRQQESRYPRA